MSRGLSHSELEELLGAYALDAVDGDERDAVELHLRECPRCRAEVADHREVAAALAQTGGPAPDGVWDRIVQSLEEPQPDAPLAPVVPMAQGRRTVSARVAAVVGIAAAVVAAFLGYKVVDDSRRIDHLTAAQRSDAVTRAALNALADPTSRRVQLASADARPLVQAVVRRDGTGYLLDSRLPRLAPGRTYQLWALVGTTRISAGVLGDAVRTTAFTAAGDFWGLAITEEAAPGVTTTDKAPVAVGRLA